MSTIKNDWYRANSTTWQCAAFEVYVENGQWRARDSLSHVVHPMTFATDETAKRICDMSPNGFEVHRKPVGASYTSAPTFTVTSGGGTGPAVTRRDVPQSLWSKVTSFFSKFV